MLGQHLRRARDSLAWVAAGLAKLVIAGVFQERFTTGALGLVLNPSWRIRSHVFKIKRAQIPHELCSVGHYSFLITFFASPAAYCSPLIK